MAAQFGKAQNGKLVPCSRFMQTCKTNRPSSTSAFPLSCHKI